jgi:2-keto-4-pentenoate hydratase/2-oxohepta-3-ene-1,7-dioic acid hydratase in catechol pathway
MKLFRFGETGKEKPGVLINGKKFDLSAFGEDIGESFFESDGLTRLAIWLKQNQNALAEIKEDARFGSCIQRPSKIICIGLNYTKHALESKMPLPKEPIIFFK